MNDDAMPLQEVRTDALVKRLTRLGNYSIKHTTIGWWVDGCYGYLVAGYYDNKKDAVINAILNIKQAKKDDIHPSWLFE